MDARERLEVIAAYGGVLAGRRHSVGPESSLPYPKPVIHRALAAEIRNPTNPDYLQALTVGYVQLASFLPESEARLVQAAEDTLIGARDLIQEGTEEARERAVEMVREIDEGVPTIQRRVRDRMEARLKEAEALMREGGTEMAEGETPQE
jgi:hypothetical protein